MVGKSAVNQLENEDENGHLCCLRLMPTVVAPAAAAASRFFVTWPGVGL